NLCNEIKDILKRQGNTIPKPYLFPILKSGMSDIEISKAVDLFCHNQWFALNRIRKKLKFERSLSLYTARHSFADGLGVNNYNHKKMSQLMGQSTPTMAMNYMGKQQLHESVEAQNDLRKRLFMLDVSHS